MKDKKKLVLVIVLCVAIISIIVRIYLYNNKDANKKKENPNDGLKQTKYNIVKKLTIDRNSYGLFSSYNTDFFVFSNGNIFYLLDKDGKELKQSNNRILLYTDSFNNKSYYLIDNILYDSNHNEVYKLDSGIYIDDIYNNYIISTKGKISILNLDSKDEKLVDNIIGYYGEYIVAVENSSFVVNTNGWTKYNEMKKRADEAGIKLTNKDESIYLDFEKGIVKESDYNKIKINDKYYIDYEDCGKVKKISNNEPISDKCFSIYNKSKTNDNLVALYTSLMEAPYMLINDELKEYNNLYNGEFKDSYYIGYDRDNPNIINLMDEKGNVERSNCPYILSYIDDDIFYCTTPFSSKFVEKNDILDKRYENISCNQYGYCDVEESSINGLHALYYKNEQLIEPHYYKIELYGEYIILTDLFNVDILFLSKDKEQLKIEDIKPSEIKIDLDIDKIIKENNIEEYREIINNNLDFFKKYAYSLEINKNLGIYKKYMYDYFKVVIDQKQYVNEAIFFSALSTLSFEVTDRLEVVGAAGVFRDQDNQIALLDKNKDSEKTIYHEIMHFIDYYLNSNKNKKVGFHENGYITEEEYEKLSLDEKIKINSTIYFDNPDIRLFVEGGAEKNSAHYFRNDVSITYQTPVSVYKAFEYVFGKKDMDRLFYGDAGLLELSKDYIDRKMYEELVEHSNNITYDFLQKTDYYEILFDTLITIYKNKNNVNWTEDKKFILLLGTIIKNTSFDDDLSDSIYYEDIKKIKQWYEKEILADLKRNIKAKYSEYEEYDVTPLVNIEGDKVYIYIYTSLTNENRGFFKVDYNLDTKEFKVLEYINEKTAKSTIINN